ncbi:MAG TPA: VOC family protein [Puia sp.]|nr:VOC family protein [Puia sp.]
MNFSLNRVILFVQNVELLKGFYRKNFRFEVLEEIRDEWVVLGAGNCELALHKAGVAVDSGETNNVKIVFETDEDLGSLREGLVRNNVSMGEIRSFEGFTDLFCDGRDAEGNVFQLVQKVGSRS